MVPSVTDMSYEDFIGDWNFYGGEFGGDVGSLQLLHPSLTTKARVSVTNMSYDKDFIGH